MRVGGAKGSPPSGDYKVRLLIKGEKMNQNVNKTLTFSAVKYSGGGVLGI